MKVNFTDDSALNPSLLTTIKRKYSDDVAIESKINLSLLEQTKENIRCPLLNESCISVLNEERSLDKSKLFMSGIIGIGTGLAMMPIFNKEVKELSVYGIDVHDYKTAFIASTLNTLLLTSSVNTVNLYNHFIEDIHHQQLTNIQKVVSNLTKIGGVVSSIIPISMMWNIELHDQKVDQSKGFDKFITWAIVGTIPLLILKFVECYEMMDKLSKNNVLDSTGDKLITYTTTALSAVARGISFSVITSEIAKNMGFEDKTADNMGVLIGGILVNVIEAVNQHFNIKTMFEKRTNPMSSKEFAAGLFSAVEGLWFALPTVTVGLNYTSTWNPLLRGILFVPYLISKTTSEALNIYKAFNMKDNKINVVI